MMGMISECKYAMGYMHLVTMTLHIPSKRSLSGMIICSHRVASAAVTGTLKCTVVRPSPPLPHHAILGATGALAVHMASTLKSQRFLYTHKATVQYTG